MQTITNDDGDVVTRINVMHVYSYDVEQIAADLLEDNRATGNDGIVITLDDVLERIRDLAADDFMSNSGQLIYQDENGNDY